MQPLTLISTLGNDATNGRKGTKMLSIIETAMIRTGFVIRAKSGVPRATALSFTTS